jgi:integrase
MALFAATIRSAEGTVQSTGGRSFPVARPRFQKGYLRLRGKSWEVRFREDYLSPDGRLRRRHRSIVLGQFQSKKQARRAAEAYLRPLNQGTCRPRTDITLEDFWSRYYEPEILPTLKVSGRKTYRSLFHNHLLPYFGTRKLAEIQRVEVQRFISLKQSEGKSTETLAHLRNLLSALFATAISWGMVEANPASGVKLPPMERRRESRVLSADEIRKLLGALPEPSRSICGLGVATGLRIGELLGLKVNDLDFERATLNVRRAIYRGTVSTPKTAKSERLLPLAAPVVAMLRAYLKNRAVELEWLFPSKAGGPLNDRNLMRRQVEPVCKALGLPRFGWHSLRHTVRTMAGNHGIAPELVQGVLGHADLETTMRYMHRVGDAERAAVEKVAEVLCPKLRLNHLKR